MPRLNVALIGLCLAALALTSACSSATTAGEEVEPGVVFLGARTVKLHVERDVIPVGAVDGRFSALRVHVSDSPLEMYDIRVTFGNGEKWSPPTRLRFARDSWTRRIDLPGRKRIVRKVEFFYRSKRPKTGKARVQVFGLR